MTETFIEVAEQKYRRLHIKTHVVMADDVIAEIIEKYAKEFLLPHDLVFISERVVAITQGRAYKISDIQPSFWAKFFVRFVYKSPYGIGLGRPQTMELAIREAGLARIFLAAAAAAITKPFGWRGVFYRVAGRGVNAIDGPCDYTLPPYNQYAVLGPRDPSGVAQSLARRFGADFVIIDANDLGVNVLGTSGGVDKELATQIFRDNPLGQGSEQTPVCIVRPV